MVNKSLFNSFFVFILSIIFLGSTTPSMGIPALSQYGSAPIGASLPSGIATHVQNLIISSGVFSEGNMVNLGLTPAPWSQIDPANVGLHLNSTLGIWEVGEYASYQNFLGISVGKDYTLNAGDAQMVFSNTDLGPGNNSFNNPAPFVSALEANGGKLDFFLLANGAAGGVDLHWTDTTVNTPVAGANVNPDSPFNHSLAFLDATGHFLLYAWDDVLLQFGDFDFNDLFILVASRNKFIVPEPGTYLLMGTFLFFAIALRRYKKAHALERK